MSIDITFTLSNADLERFEKIVEKGRELVADPGRAQEVEQAARDLLDQAGTGNLPDFISERLLKLETLLNMVQDQEWQLADDERKRVLSALSYFALDDDLIPDHVPGVGFLDDAIYTEIIIQELDAELRLYNEFCQYRIAEEGRRRSRGQDTRVGREDWLADKRSVLHSRMRARRSGGSGAGGWRTRFF
jgi:uncharacterized membrane protein YkvA (DUF1232 family)